MFGNICYLLIIVLTFLMSGGPLAGQTVIHGKLMSVDGRIIPETVISIQQENQMDIFSGYEDIQAEADGSYSLTIPEPGLYNITFGGIYHRSMTVPFLVIDQPAIEMDVLLFPIYFNDGRYFENDEYLQWIRVIGNFNNYDYLTGRSFSRNGDGSISAFIPVKSDTDTVRHQVKGLGYGWGGPTPLPPADEYQVRDDRSFESVLYRNLPADADSLEIRYVPGETIPFQRILPEGAKEEWRNANGFINFKYGKDRHWVEPVRLAGYFRRASPIIERNLVNGLSVEEQAEYLEKYYSLENSDYLVEVKQQILTDLNNRDIHPQQRAILCVGYAALLNRIEMRKHMLTHTQQEIWERFGGASSEEMEQELQRLDEITINKEILLQIPELVAPVHPVWNRVQMLPQFLLEATNGHPVFINYFMEIVKHYPREFTIRRVVSALVRELAGDFDNVEEMEVYQIVVERFGEGDMARRAHEMFRASRLQGR